MKFWSMIFFIYIHFFSILIEGSILREHDSNKNLRIDSLPRQKRDCNSPQKIVYMPPVRVRKNYMSPVAPPKNYMQPVNARPRVTSNQPTKRIIVVKNSEKDKIPCPQDISHVSNNEYTRPIAITPPISYTEQTTLSQVRPVVYLQETVPYRPTFLSPDRVFTTSSSVPVSSANLDTSSIPLNTAQYYFVSERFQSPQPSVPVSSANQGISLIPPNTAPYYFVSERIPSPQLTNGYMESMWQPARKPITVVQPPATK
ncbi:uncharacterized protein LOC111630261 isoform X2 [Centruroides sculpturatus]|uniref:uncharacterized protein LOC111630261 isoform X2 n=1 Tax=Centruroides sculpturatus TaxID=218467 RepID=UPI000C6E31C4|nr:uncharacterized protein LOC111630261 isoform X2 [Centruroides sculpturatus]